MHLIKFTNSYRHVVKGALADFPSGGAWHCVAGTLIGFGIRIVPAFVTVCGGFLSLQPLSAHVSVYSPRSLIILIEIESSYFHELYLFASHRMIIYEQKREEHQNMKVSKQTACEVLSFQYLFFVFFFSFILQSNSVNVIFLKIETYKN